MGFAVLPPGQPVSCGHSFLAGCGNSRGKLGFVGGCVALVVAAAAACTAAVGAGPTAPPTGARSVEVIGLQPENGHWTIGQTSHISISEPRRRHAIRQRNTFERGSEADPGVGAVGGLPEHCPYHFVLTAEVTACEAVKPPTIQHLFTTFEHLEQRGPLFVLQ